VPLRVAVPFPLSLKLTPLGSVVPVSTKVGTGKPVAITVNELEAPTANVVLLALVIDGASFTVNVKFCVALLPTPLLAVKEMEYCFPVPATGVPLRVPVPFLLSTNVTPLGNVAPPLVKLGIGKPVAFTVNVPLMPTVKVVLLPLVMVGG
jgi:hypothetical protein